MQHGGGDPCYGMLENNCDSYSDCAWDYGANECRRVFNNDMGDQCDKYKTDGTCDSDIDCFWDFHSGTCGMHPQGHCQELSMELDCNRDEACFWDHQNSKCEMQHGGGDPCYGMLENNCDSYSDCAWDYGANECRRVFNNDMGDQCDKYKTDATCDSDIDCFWDFHSGTCGMHPQGHCQELSMELDCNRDEACFWDHQNSKCEMQHGGGDPCYGMLENNCDSYSDCAWDYGANECRRVFNNDMGDQCDKYKTDGPCDSDIDCFWDFHSGTCGMHPQGHCQELSMELDCNRDEACFWDHQNSKCEMQHGGGDPCYGMLENNCDSYSDCAWDFGANECRRVFDGGDCHAISDPSECHGPQCIWQYEMCDFAHIDCSSLLSNECFKQDHCVWTGEGSCVDDCNGEQEYSFYFKNNLSPFTCTGFYYYSVDTGRFSYTSEGCYFQKVDKGNWSLFNSDGNIVRDNMGSGDYPLGQSSDCGEAPMTNAPTDPPTNAPTTNAPTDPPTNAPTTNAPTDPPTNAPTTNAPTDPPTNAPTTNAPTDPPTYAPTTNAPTDAPTTNAPTDAPTEVPTDAPTDAPTEVPTDDPTATPTKTPTKLPTGAPTQAPTNFPTKAPTGHPTITLAFELSLVEPEVQVDDPKSNSSLNTDTGAEQQHPCFNRIVDGDESDVDCGGSQCAECPVGSACSVDSDCLLSDCKGGICSKRTAEQTIELKADIIERFVAIKTQILRRARMMIHPLEIRILQSMISLKMSCQLG